MTWAGRILLALSLAADAFAAALSLGAARPEKTRRLALQSGLLFGLFQGLMPVLGYAFGGLWASFLPEFEGLISFLLLTLLGVQMLLAGRKKEQRPKAGGKTLWALAFATSVDAWTVGIPLVLQQEPLALDAGLIALVTSLLSALGVLLGGRFGGQKGRQATVLGGIALLLLGLKFLLAFLLKG